VLRAASLTTEGVPYYNVLVHLEIQT